MRVLRSIVAPPTTLMSSCETKFTGCCRIRFEIVRDKLVWDKAILLQKLAHEFQRRTLVPSALNQHIKHFALGIHGAPKIDHTAGDFQIDLVKMPDGVGLGSTFAQVRRDQGPEMIHPAPNGLVGDHNAAFRQQVFDVTEAQCEPEIEPDRLLDDLWRKAVAAIADFLHSRGYRTASGTASPKRRDNALATGSQWLFPPRSRFY